MKNSNNKRTIVLAIILVALLVLAYKVMFMSSEESLTETGNNALASQRVETLLKKIERIKFDLDIMQNEKFKSLESIETPLVALPIGKANPFAD